MPCARNAGFVRFVGDLRVGSGRGFLVRRGPDRGAVTRAALATR
jgi:hypothetical protein